MKIPIRLKMCECGGETLVWFLLEDTDIRYKCAHCGKEQDLSIRNLRKAIKVILRAQYELFENKDYSLSIVLSAMAFECDLNRLYKKWKMLEAMREKKIFLSSEHFDDALRRMCKVFDKFKTTADLMTDHDITGFVINSPDLQRIISEKFPCVPLEKVKKDLKEEFEKSLFFPRNNVIHAGKQYDEKAANCAREFALLGMTILEKMNKARIAKSRGEVHSKS